MTRILKNDSFANERYSEIIDTDGSLVVDTDDALLLGDLHVRNSLQRSELVTGVQSTVVLPKGESSQSGIARSGLVTGVEPTTTVRSAG